MHQTHLKNVKIASQSLHLANITRGLNHMHDTDVTQDMGRHALGCNGGRLLAATAACAARIYSNPERAMVRQHAN